MTLSFGVYSFLSCVSSTRKTALESRKSCCLSKSARISLCDAMGEREQDTSHMLSFFFSPQRGAIRFDKTKWEWLRKRKKMKERRQGKPGKQNEALSFFRNQKPSFLTFFLLFSKSVLSFRRVSSPPPFQASAPLCLCAGGKKKQAKVQTDSFSVLTVSSFFSFVRYTRTHLPMNKRTD